VETLSEKKLGFHFNIQNTNTASVVQKTHTTHLRLHAASPATPRVTTALLPPHTTPLSHRTLLLPLHAAAPHRCYCHPRATPMPHRYCLHSISKKKRNAGQPLCRAGWKIQPALCGPSAERAYAGWVGPLCHP